MSHKQNPIKIHKKGKCFIQIFKNSLLKNCSLTLDTSHPDKKTSLNIKPIIILTKHKTVKTKRIIIPDS